MIRINCASASTLLLLAESVRLRMKTLFLVIVSMVVMPQIVVVISRAAFAELLSGTVSLPHQANNPAISSRKLSMMNPIEENSVTTLKVISPLFGVIAFITIICVLASGRTQVFMPRKPATIASKLLYLCNSENLLADSRTLAPSVEGGEPMVGRYSFGWFRNYGNNTGWVVGVDRRDELAVRYKFGETDPSAENLKEYEVLEKRQQGIVSV